MHNKKIKNLTDDVLNGKCFLQQNIFHGEVFIESITLALKYKNNQ